MNGRRVFVFDLDGTLADIRHRLGYIQQKPKDWNAFHDACHMDTPIYPTIEIARALWYHDADLWIVTGRSKRVEEKTRDWLKLHYIPYVSLVMRDEGDHREDYEFKRAWYKGLDRCDKVMLHGVFEDRARVVSMWRELGVPCFAVGAGDY